MAVKYFLRLSLVLDWSKIESRKIIIIPVLIIIPIFFKHDESMIVWKCTGMYWNLVAPEFDLFDNVLEF